MKKKLHYPTPEESRKAREEITKLCEEMIREGDVPHLYKYSKFWIPLLIKRYPGSVEFLELEPEEMIRRYRMGIKAAKLLIPPAGCRKLTPEEKKAGRRILPVEIKVKHTQ
jgi:hypothetical protein